jgi:hypothetical protein
MDQWNLEKLYSLFASSLYLHVMRFVDVIIGVCDSKLRRRLTRRYSYLCYTPMPCGRNHRGSCVTRSRSAEVFHLVIDHDTILVAHDSRVLTIPVSYVALDSTADEDQQSSPESDCMDPAGFHL